MGSSPEGCLFLPAVNGLKGSAAVPGDKSISHRAVLLGAVNDGPVHVTGFLRSADTLASVRAVRALGVIVDECGDELTIHGQGWEGLREPDDVVDVANAGTLIRLLPGLLASRDFLCVLTGDASIRRRPMARVLEPLAAMGATVTGRKDNTLPPIALRGGRLRGITYSLPVASAQVKSCLLLAGLRAEGETHLIEPFPSRDHTERMVAHAGGKIERTRLADGRNKVSVLPCTGLKLGDVAVPGDFSSAAFFVVGALLIPGSEVRVTGVGLNPTRTGLTDVLLRMGADLEVEHTGSTGPEPVGAILAHTSELKATDVDAGEVPGLIDELPLFLLAAAGARGTSRLRGAGDLRSKESDRLSSMAALLRALEVDVVEHPDGMDVTGLPGGWRGGRILSMADHRLAMVGAIAGAASREGVHVDDVVCAAISYPEFVDTLARLGGRPEPDVPSDDVGGRL
jgi:3-phosphoshikimate 1-carboxyvinyltransferase